MSSSVLVFVCVGALVDMEKLFKRHPAELKSNRYASIHHLMGRIKDGDKQVRRAFYKVFKNRILKSIDDDGKEVCVCSFPTCVFCNNHVFSSYLNSRLYSGEPGPCSVSFDAIYISRYG